MTKEKAGRRSQLRFGIFIPVMGDALFKIAPGINMEGGNAFDKTA